MNEQLTSDDYMKAAEPIEASCLRCGIIMSHMTRHAKYGCCNCGIVVMRDGTVSKYLLPKVK